MIRTGRHIEVRKTDNKATLIAASRRFWSGSTTTTPTTTAKASRKAKPLADITSREAGEDKERNITFHAQIVGAIKDLHLQRYQGGLEHT